MSFWAYMLQCRGGYFYIGHTEDLAQRIAQHEHGEFDGYTRNHLPIALVWSQEFATRDEAKAAERQIKGWSRAKKLALIRGDWARISHLAKKKGSPFDRLRTSPSTSSGWADGEVPGPETGPGPEPEPEPQTAPHPVYPELVEGEVLSLSKGLPFLKPHPNAPPLAVTAIRARITAITEHWLTLRWSVAGSNKVVLPEFAGKRRTDGLWRNTCFELFLQPFGSEAYVEINLSPSEGWAAYDFASYRSGMTERAMSRQPNCTTRIGSNTLIFDAAIPMAGLPPLPWSAGLTAVIEEEGGAMSYWALAHPPEAPDFHHPACLALTVAAPQAS